MESADIYLQYKEHLLAVSTLLSRFNKYKNCFAINIFNAELDHIIKNVHSGYQFLVILTHNDLHSQADGPAVLAGYDEEDWNAHQNLPTITQLSNFVHHKQNNIITKLTQLDEFKRRSLLDHMAHCRQLMLKLVTKMETMILQSQYINQSIRISA